MPKGTGMMVHPGIGSAELDLVLDGVISCLELAGDRATESLDDGDDHTSNQDEKNDVLGCTCTVFVIVELRQHVFEIVHCSLSLPV